MKLKIGQPNHFAKRFHLIEKSEIQKKEHLFAQKKRVQVG